MGNKCSSNFRLSQSFSTTTRLQVNPSLQIKAAYRLAPNVSMYDFHQKQNIRKFSVQIDCREGQYKFTPYVGFQFQQKIKQENMNQFCDQQICFSIKTQENGKMRIQVSNLNGSIEKLQRRVSEFGSVILENDVIRVGKKTMKLTHFIKENEIDGLISNLVKTSSKSGQCRICFQSQQSPSNRLINPCRCTGSVSMIHQQCLSQWIFQQQLHGKSFTNSLQFKICHRYCEICKYGYENYIWERVLNLMRKYRGNYAILQTQGTNECVLFRFTQKCRSFKIGRRDNCDFVFKDQCCSKINCILELENERLVLRDKSSRFGTGVVMESNILEPNCEYILGKLYFRVSD